MLYHRCCGVSSNSILIKAENFLKRIFLLAHLLRDFISYFHPNKYEKANEENNFLMCHLSGYYLHIPCSISRYFHLLYALSSELVREHSLARFFVKMQQNILIFERRVVAAWPSEEGLICS